MKRCTIEIFLLLNSGLYERPFTVFMQTNFQKLVKIMSFSAISWPE